MFGYPVSIEAKLFAVLGEADTLFQGIRFRAAGTYRRLIENTQPQPHLVVPDGHLAPGTTYKPNTIFAMMLR